MTTLPVPDHPPPGASGDPGPADLARLVESCRGWPGTDGLTVQAVRAAHSARVSGQGLVALSLASERP